MMRAVVVVAGLSLVAVAGLYALVAQRPAPLSLPGADTPAAAPVPEAGGTSPAAPLPADPAPPGPDSTAALPAADPSLAYAVDPADVDSLARALPFLEHGDLAAAETAAGGTGALVDVVRWLAIRDRADGVTPDMIAAFAARHPHWPSAKLMRQRAEQLIAAGDHAPQAVAAAFAASPPTSRAGFVAQIRALLAVDRQAEAATAARAYWSATLDDVATDAAFLAEFGPLLDPAAHKARYDLLMYADRFDEALALTGFLPDGYAGLAEARQAATAGRPDALARLDRVAGPARSDPLVAFSRAEWLRRQNRDVEAAAALQGLDGTMVERHGDAWWPERRIISRGVLEAGRPDLAYRIVAEHRGGGGESLAEAHFHAGWYALRFLKDPGRAELHFRDLAAMATLPITRARAAYWLGRSTEAAGRLDDARSHYRVAATDETTYYGQLARVKLGETRLGLPDDPVPTEADVAAFRNNDLVRAMLLLEAVGRDGEAAILYPEIARAVTTGGQLTLLARRAAGRGNHRLALAVGKIAAERDLGAESLAFPLDAIPAEGRSGTAIEPALVYAISRQESTFDPRARSPAGALGLMQLLPATAEATARDLGLSYATERLTSDPAYNALLGAAHFRDLVEDFGGSYILSIAAYNAGKRRPGEWMRRFGDPRHPEVDPVDWVELIPFAETRSYVQRVMENLQVYRERLDDTPLSIAEDLRRGR